MEETRTIFKWVEDDYLPSGIMEMYSYTLYSNKNKLLSILAALKSEVAKGNESSNIRNSIGWINSILEEYKDIISFKERQELNNPTPKH